ncbi:hypothetical protein [Empedobacter brevis]|uniref:hypothetical protein n=1 Tax=Empedobacter brevis TaxID=247 RepID=UPI0028AEDC92|nr:hypothetical protein [Empedobacter brevis]
MDTYKKVWRKIIQDLENDDIIIEINIENIILKDWNTILSLIKNYYNSNITICIPISLADFPKLDKDDIQSVKINFKRFEINLDLFDPIKMNFYTDSIINLTVEDILPLFRFCEDISNSIEKKIYIYCEGYKFPSAKFYKKWEW